MERLFVQMFIVQNFYQFYLAFAYINFYFFLPQFAFYLLCFALLNFQFALFLRISYLFF